MEELTDGDWAQAVASAVAARAPLTSGSAQQIEQTFAGARDLRICLIAGEGRYGELEAYTLLRNGVAEARPLAPEPLLCSPAELSAARRALQDDRLVSVTVAPDSNAPADWQRPAVNGGTWLLAAPLTPTNSGSRSGRSRPLGVVLVGGHGREPSVDAQWLQEWASEMAGLIQHASVQLMESSLDMLGVIFPPRVLEQLVANAARKTGQMDLAAVLRSSSVSPTLSGVPTAPPTLSGPSSVRSSLEGRPPLPPVGGASSARSSLGEVSPLPAGQALREGGWPAPPPAAEAAWEGGRAGSPWPRAGREYAGASPFAAAAGSEGGPAGSFSPSRGSPTRPPLSPSAALLRHASQGSSASALLRQVSMQSGLGMPFVQDAAAEVPLTPHSQTDLSGFEDILAEDHRCSLERRPSMAPERARSHTAPSLDACIAAATAAMEESEAGGLPAAVHAAQAHVAEQTAAAVAAAAADVLEQQGQQQAEPAALFDQRRQQEEGAAGTASAGSMFSGSSPFGAAARASSMPPPARAAAAADSPPPPARAAQLTPSAVRVPWQKKPLMHPLTSGDARGKEQPLLSPRKPSSVDSVASAFGSSFGGSSCFASGAGSAFSAPSADAPPHASASKPSATPGTTTPGCASLGSCGSAASSAQGPASSAAARQSWDLSFASPALEASYRRWLAPYLLKNDTCLGLVHLLTAVTMAVALVHQGCLGAHPRSLLSLAGLLLMAASTLPAWLRPNWWATWRSPVLSLARVLATTLFAAHSVLAAADVAPGASGAEAQAPGPWVEKVLVSSGTAALAFLPIRFPLAFSLHLPLQLLCLWLLTAASSLAHVLSGGTTPVGSIILAQLLLGFLLSSAVSYRREHRLRASFLKSRRAASCLNGRGKRPPLPASAS